MSAEISSQQLAALQAIDTCTVANAIEKFEVRLRNEGFADSSIRSITACPKPVIGYAVTVRVRCSSPPMRGGVYADRTDWWNSILAMPAPRIAVIQDVDDFPGTGSFLGDVHANILKALGCVAAVTNGSVRDVPAIEQTGFKLFGKHVSVSHAYVHVVEYGGTVEVGKLAIKPGDLLHADSHGVLSIPKGIAGEIPATAAKLLERENAVIKLCQSKEFSLEKLRDAVHGIFN